MMMLGGVGKSERPEAKVGVGRVELRVSLEFVLKGLKSSCAKSFTKKSEDHKKYMVNLLSVAETTASGRKVRKLEAVKKVLRYQGKVGA